MQVGDMVQFKKDKRKLDDRLVRFVEQDEIGLIVDVRVTETYAASGCKTYIVITAKGDEFVCFPRDIEVQS